MVNIWKIKSNQPCDWDFNGIEIVKGRREINYFIDNDISFINPIKIKNDDGSDFLNKLSSELNCTSESYINTITVYNHCDYIIQCSYRSDLDYNDGFNYFGTIVNLEAVNIFGSAIFFKLENNKLVNLEKEDVLTLLINFYYVKTYKLTSGNFEEISFNNFEPDIDQFLKGYTVKKINSWYVFSDDNKSNIENLKESNNDINEFDNLIWLKKKVYYGEIYNSIQSLNLENNREGDMRGQYMDLNIDIIKKTFF